MDRTERYRDILKQVIQEYATYGKDPPGVETYASIDPFRDSYSVQRTGWDRQRYLHGCIIHMDLKDGKIWVQHDGTNLPVVDELEAAGVPKEDIVLGFIPPNRRKYTEYAIG